MDVVTTLLSAGVIAAIVEGVFSIAATKKTNKKLQELEMVKHKYEMGKTKYEQVDEYYKELLNQEEKFTYDGKIEQTLECVSKLFILRIKMFELFEKEHEEHNYLFSDSENMRIKEKEKIIDDYLDDFKKKFQHNPDEDEFTKYITLITVAIDTFKEEYYSFLKRKMDDYLNDK